MAGIVDWLRVWIWNPEYLPAWLTALAAIVALAISVWATIRVGAEERRRYRLERRGIAMAVYPELLKLPATIGTARHNLETLKKNLRGLMGQQVAASLQQYGTLVVPPMIERNVDRLFLLGGLAGPASIQLVSTIEQHNAVAELLVQHVSIMGVDEWAETVNQLSESLQLIERSVAKSDAELKPFFDTISD